MGESCYWKNIDYAEYGLEDIVGHAVKEVLLTVLEEVNTNTVILMNGKLIEIVFASFWYLYL